jgi:S1-C subfamily serine protease
MVRRQRIAELLGLGAIAAALLASLAEAGLLPGQAGDAAAQSTAAHFTAAQTAAANAAAAPHSAGSGFAVAPGLVVTNAHFTRGCHAAGLPIATPEGSGAWRVVSEEPDTDLALLAAPPALAGPLVPPPLPLSAARRLSPGTGVLVLGRAAVAGRIAGETLTVHQPGSGLARSLHLADAAGHAVTPTWADGLAYFGAENAGRLRWVVEITAGTRPGDSGGPVVDGAGAVVGVVFAGLPEGPTSAVVLTDLMAFLARAGLLPAFAPPPDGGADPGAVAAAAHGVIRLAC